MTAPKFSILPTAQLLFSPDTVTNDEGLLSDYCNEIKDQHMQLGICLSYDPVDDHTTEVIKDTMLLLASLYEKLHNILQERDECLEEYAKAEHIEGADA